MPHCTAQNPPQGLSVQDDAAESAQHPQTCTGSSEPASVAGLQRACWLKGCMRVPSQACWRTLSLQVHGAHHAGGTGSRRHCSQPGTDPAHSPALSCGLGIALLQRRANLQLQQGMAPCVSMHCLRGGLNRTGTVYALSDCFNVHLRATRRSLTLQQEHRYFDRIGAECTAEAWITPGRMSTCVWAHRAAVAPRPPRKANAGRGKQVPKLGQAARCWAI